MIFDKDIQQVVFSHEEILSRIEELGKRISADLKGEKLLLVGVLSGSILFMSHLLESLDLPCEIDFIKCSSYEGISSTGSVVVKKDIDRDPKGKDVLLVEDIVDTGLTVSLLKKSLLARGAKSVRVVSLLDKPSGRQHPVTVDYHCFECPNAFIVGFGLDYNQLYRNLPYIGILTPEALEAGKKQ